MKEVNAQLSHVLFNAIGIYSVGQAAGLFVPSRVGAYAKVPIIMKLDNLSYETGISTVNVETFYDLVYLCFAGIVSFFLLSSFFLSNTSLSLVLVMLIIGLFAVGFFLLLMFKNIKELQMKLAALYQDVSKTIFIRAPAISIGKLVELILSTKELLHKKKLAAELGSTTLIAQFFGIAGLFLVIGSVHTILPFTQVFALLTISYIIGIMSLVPGGFGASDLSLIILLGSEGIPVAVATNITILWRVAMYLPIFVIIGVFLVQQKISGKSIIK
jgi:uncharacterized protein (TIRG00374 family)